MKNVNYLELQYGEVGWRSDVLTPSERFLKGTIGSGAARVRRRPQRGRDSRPVAAL